MRRFFDSVLVLLQGGNVVVLKGDNTTTADPSDRLAVSRAYPHTFGQALVQLVPSTEAKSAKHSSIRYLNLDHFSTRPHNMLSESAERRYIGIGHFSCNLNPASL